MKILITGYGKMGRMVEELAQQKGWEILAALDGQDAKLLRQLKKADAAVDFSHPAMLDSLANYIRRTGTPLISGTTGYSEEQMELVEKHHNQKADAPSGTAKMLADALDPHRRLRRISGREGFCGARDRDEMGMFALRGGTVAGEHTLYFFGEDETLSFSHSAASRRIFAAGAVKAAELLAGKDPGFYTLDEILFSTVDTERMD